MELSLGRKLCVAGTENVKLEGEGPRKAVWNDKPAASLPFLLLLLLVFLFFSFFGMVLVDVVFCRSCPAGGTCSTIRKHERKRFVGDLF